MRHQEESLYAQAFAMHLRGTDEKAVLAKEITDRVKLHKSRSIIDIGAGRGEIAIRIFRRVERYLAIERRPDYAARLQEYGIRVLRRTFPCEVPAMFSMALMSHSVPSGARERAAMIDAAWELLVPGGVMLIITYDSGENTAWHEFLVGSGLRDPRAPSQRLHQLREYVQSLPEVASISESRIDSTLSHTNERDMIDAMGFVYTDGRADSFRDFSCNPRVRMQIARCFSDDHYSFPFTHACIEVVKERQKGKL